MSSTALALDPVKVPSHIKLDGGRGNENVGNNVEIPRLKLLQKLSDELDRNKASYEPDAQDGNFFNTISKQNYGDDVYVVSVLFKKTYVVWKNRDAGQGGGKLGTYDSWNEAEAAIQETGDKPEVWSIVDTDEHLFLVKDPVSGIMETTPCVFEMSGTKQRASRAMNAQIGAKRGDRFAGVWKMSAFHATSKSGAPYVGLNVGFEGWTTKEEFTFAESVYKQFAN